MKVRFAGASRLVEAAGLHPFLEDGSCSIYDERSIACREYLATSFATRARAARNPDPGTPRPGPEIPWEVFARFSRDRRGEGFGR